MKARAEPFSYSEAERNRRTRLWRLLLLVSVFVVLAVWLATQMDEICLQRGRANLRSRNHDRALVWLEWAQWCAPDRAEVAFYLARANRRLQRFDAVRQYLSKADVLGYDIGQLEREQWLALAQTSQFSEMDDHWSELFLDAADDGPELSNAYVTWCLSRLNLQDGLRVISAWEADFPADPQPHFMRGRVNEVMLRWAEAVEEYQVALALDDTRNDVRFRLGNALMHLLKNDAAVRELRACLAVDPLHADATVALSKCLFKLDDESASRQLLQELVQRHPTHVPALHALGDLELTASNYQAAENALSRAVAIKPEDQTIRYALTKALQRLGRKEEAREHLQFVQEATKPLLRLANLTADLVEDPNNIELRSEIAQITWKYKSHEEGAQWFHSLLDLAPGHAATHLALAEHYTLKGDQEQVDFHRRLAEPVEGGKR